MTQVKDIPLIHDETPAKDPHNRASARAFPQRGRPETQYVNWEEVPSRHLDVGLHPAEVWGFSQADFALQLQRQMSDWTRPEDSETVPLEGIHYWIGSEMLPKASAKRYFRRKTSEVLNDDAALRLLADIYETSVAEKASFDQRGVALAKLTAANFCEIGAKVVYITDAGRRFIDAIKHA